MGFYKSYIESFYINCPAIMQEDVRSVRRKKLWHSQRRIEIKSQKGSIVPVVAKKFSRR